MEIVVAELRRSRSQVRPCPRPRDRPAAAADTRCARSEHAEDIFKYPMDSKDRWPHKLRSSPLPAEMVRTQQSRSLSVAGLLTRRCRFLLAAQPLLLGPHERRRRAL